MQDHCSINGDSSLSFLSRAGAICPPPRPSGMGEGQVQSAIGARVTVNFPHAGKILVDATVVHLTVLS